MVARKPRNALSGHVRAVSDPCGRRGLPICLFFPRSNAYRFLTGAALIAAVGGKILGVEQNEA